jgi:geranylgeranyl pyrophosphate synthase
LINLFVTTFDGICDEAPDLLPQVLPITDRVIGNFPEPWRGSLPVSDPIPHLLLEVACTTARLIRETMEDVPRNQCELVSRAIRTAYEGQLNTLKQTPRPEPAASRTSLSGATFQVSLIVGALFVDRTSVDFRALVDAGEALGSLFGWIDDVVDLESDLIGMQPNMVAALIGTESGSESESIVRRETARRWREAQRALRKVESKADDAQRELLEAAVIWLGVVESADRCG